MSQSLLPREMLQELGPFSIRAESQTRKQEDLRGRQAAPRGSPGPLKVMQGHETTRGSLWLDVKGTEGRALGQAAHQLQGSAPPVRRAEARAVWAMPWGREARTGQSGG